MSDFELMRAMLYVVSVEITVEQARRFFLKDPIEWDPGLFYDCQEAIYHNVDMEDLKFFDTYKEALSIFHDLYSSRYKDGNKWFANLIILERLDSDDDCFTFEIAPFEEVFDA